MEVTLENTGGQTLNHVAFAGGDTADAISYNPLFPKPDGTSLPDGASYAAIFPSTGCSLTGGTTNAYTGLFCDVGQLVPGVPLTYLLVINVPATAGSYPTWLTVSWNEGWSTTGTNADYAFATGSIEVGASDCGTPSASYFLPAEAVALLNGGGTCYNQTASIASGSSVGGIGGHASLGIDSTSAVCPSGLTCYGTTVSATVLGGIPVPGGLQWTITWYGTKSLTGVIHFGPNYPDVPSDFTVIPFKNKFLCSAALTTNCWVSKASSSGNADPWWFTATFITPNNYKSSGYN